MGTFWAERVTRLFELRRIGLHVTQRLVWHDSVICVTWLIHMCDMTHSYVWRDSFICVTWHIHMCDTTHSCVWHDPFICVTRLNHHMCGMTPSSHVWNDTSIILPFICVTWFIHECDTTHLSHVWHDSFITWVAWLIHMCDMTHSYVWHDSFVSRVARLFYEMHLAWLIHHITTHHICDTHPWHCCHVSFICDTWLFRTCGMTHSYMWWRNWFIYVVAWLIHICGMTHFYVWHDSCIHVKGRIDLYHMTLSYVYFDAFVDAFVRTSNAFEEFIHTH